MGKEWSVDDDGFFQKIHSVSENLREAILKALKTVILGIPAKIASETTGIRPQRDTGYMQGAYSVYVGKDLVADEEIVSPKGKGQFKTSPRDWVQRVRGHLHPRGAVCGHPEAGKRTLEDGRVIQLTGRKPGTGPGWVDKLTEPVNAEEILEELNDHIKDNMKEFIS
ncbi:hypothetical protein LEP1GSC161_0333 [Leptospira santarosai str. CBC1416]|uniref:Uncharacterized protein n=1 Tax=Leptospira santarosai str. CBC1416 TaxID=1193059 RepID=M6VRQ1_9LEPT|nr:hypothetical protein LEP1GSC161_0333 [Leptospira santarosai str. CBC1416]